MVSVVGAIDKGRRTPLQTDVHAARLCDDMEDFVPAVQKHMEVSTVCLVHGPSSSGKQLNV